MKKYNHLIEWYTEFLSWIEMEREKIKQIIEELKKGNLPKEVDSLKDYILWVTFYHLEEKTERLKEIGGRGVGGLEPKYVPKYLSGEPVSRQRELILLAIQQEIWRRYNEAMMDYVNGNFVSTIFVLVSLTEGVLKLELERKGVNTKGLTLGHIIHCCKCRNILQGKEIITQVNFINKTRNDLIHFNLMKEKPEEVLNIKETNLHEKIFINNLSGEVKKKIRLPEKASIIYMYKPLAYRVKIATDGILKFLYKK